MAFGLLLLLLGIVLLNAALTGKSIPDVIKGATKFDTSKTPSFSVKPKDKGKTQ